MFSFIFLQVLQQNTNFAASNFSKRTYQQQDLVPVTLSHLVELWLYITMAFGDLLDLVGGTGRFQIMHVTFLSIPVMMMASHNLLQNFVASVPHHYCSEHTNTTQSALSPEEKLLITVPLDEAGNPKRCQRYAAPQWDLLDKNGTSMYGEQVELQECTDGWSYNMTERSSTIISEVGMHDFFLSVFWALACCLLHVKLCSMFVSGIWCVIYAL